MSDYVLESRRLSKTFKDAGKSIEVFSDIDLCIAKGERVAVIGRSGAGKSTLLHLLGGLDNATHGEVLLKGKDYKNLNEKQRSKARNECLGFIYQFHHLLPEFTALENVCVPILLSGCSINTAEHKATEILQNTGLGDRLNHKIGQLSGGERQRVAIARALVTSPDCVLADEPTGNLDGKTADHVFDMMLELNQKSSTSLIIVTHDEALAHRMDRVLLLENKNLTVIK